ncbi:SAMD1 protein, partial [Polypterus senegalus]
MWATQAYSEASASFPAGLGPERTSSVAAQPSHSRTGLDTAAMSEPKYREWILETIDSLRSRKARPDLERICRMVRRRHGSDPDRTRVELEKLIQDQTVLKVSYKGSISYRNAAKVQRKCRKKPDVSAGGGSATPASTATATAAASTSVAATAVADGKEAAKHAEPKNNAAGENSSSSCPEQRHCHSPGAPRFEDVGDTLPNSGNGCLGCGGSGGDDCASCKKASALKEKKVSPPDNGEDEEGDDDDDDNNNNSGGGGKTRASRGAEQDGSPQKLRQRPAKCARLPAKSCRSSADEAHPDLGDRLVASVRSLAEKRGAATVSTARGHPPPQLGLKEILGFLSSQERLSQEKLTRSKVKVVLEREVAKGRLRRTRFGNITLPVRGEARSARHAKTTTTATSPPHQERGNKRREEKDEDEAMETESSEEEEEEEEADMSEQEEADGKSSFVDECEEVKDAEVAESREDGAAEQLPLLEVAPKSPASSASSLAHPEIKQTYPGVQEPEPDPCDVPMHVEEEEEEEKQCAVAKVPPLSHNSVACSSDKDLTGPPGQHPPETHAMDESSPEEPESREAAECSPEKVEEKDDELQPTQNEDRRPRVECYPLTEPLRLNCVEDEPPDSRGSRRPVPVENCRCPVEVNVASCLLTPTASPGEMAMADERTLNGEIFVKREKASADPIDWSVSDVVSYFTAAGFGEQAGAFRNQVIRRLSFHPIGVPRSAAWPGQLHSVSAVRSDWSTSRPPSSAALAFLFTCDPMSPNLTRHRAAVAPPVTDPSLPELLMASRLDCLFR